MTANVNAAYVTAGKPKIGGAIFRAPLGTAIPTDAKTALDKAFKSLGYISDDGVKNENKLDTDDVKAWGGNTVTSLLKEKTDKFEATLIEALNVDVLKTVFGGSNVTGTLADKVTIKANSTEVEDGIYIIETVLKGGHLKRIVIPVGQISDVGEVEYKDDAVIGYEITITAKPDATENTHYEYIEKV
ncbi:phage tail protein [Mogibacterium timidum]|uniref:phage tail tube protein n=1 Tax=Mogibacterium timidum TaxID=35519 RepID=UPI00248CD02C|nr:phage tail protein [Mogibacterium timidum]